MGNAADRIRSMLAAELKLEKSVLAEDFRWLNVLGSDDAEYFLAKLNNEFATIPRGFSIGAGARPFDDEVDAQTLKRIATVGGLIGFVVMGVANHERRTDESS